MNKRIALVLGALITVATIVGCEAVTSDPVVKGHREIAENVGKWGSEFGEGWSRNDKPEADEHGPIIDTNGNGVHDGLEVIK